MQFKQRTLTQIAHLICGNDNRPDETKGFFPYLSSKYITEFFRDCDTDYALPAALCLHRLVVTAGISVLAAAMRSRGRGRRSSTLPSQTLPPPRQQRLWHDDGV